MQNWFDRNLLGLFEFSVKMIGPSYLLLMKIDFEAASPILSMSVSF